MTIMSIENTSFYHSAPPVAVVEDEPNCDNGSSSSSTTSSPISLHIPHPHHQLFLPQEFTHAEYAHLKCPEAYHDEEDEDDLNCFDDDSSSPSSYSSSLPSTCCRGERRYQQRWNGSGGWSSGSGGSSSEKVSSVKKRGGGSWLLGFARIQQQQQPQVQVQVQVERAEREGQVLSVENDKGEEDEALPGLVRSNSASSLGSSSTSTSSTSSSSSKRTKKGVSFNTSVLIRPIPHSSTYSALQKKKMYASSQEVRTNKIRNKKEYRFDGYDWRNVTEEWEMSVCMLTGELIHPAHTFEKV
mmetsp:Transcript_13327/g.27969  ORF Transcript_13327/g.27969 Transcript_13327/m.27969 type:complete len:299 (+) Transcript_13327:179-1075(+)